MTLVWRPVGAVWPETEEPSPGQMDVVRPLTPAGSRFALDIEPLGGFLLVVRPARRDPPTNGGPRTRSRNQQPLVQVWESPRSWEVASYGTS